VFPQPARNCGTLLSRKVNAERHFFTVRTQQQPTSLSAARLGERNLHPMTIEFESVGLSPAPAFDDDIVVMKGDAFVVAGMQFHMSKCQIHHQNVQTCKRKNQPCTVKRESHGNCEHHDRNGAKNEKPAARREGIVASCNESEVRRFFHRFEVQLPFMPNSVLAFPAKDCQTQTRLFFGAANCRTSLHAMARKRRRATFRARAKYKPG
jgi:hypothetical protein